MNATLRRTAIAVGIAVLLAGVTWGRIALIDHLHDHGWFAKYWDLAGRAVSGQFPVDRIGDISPAYFWLMVLLRLARLSVEAIRNLQIAGVTFAAMLCAAAAWRLQGWVAAVATAVLILGNRAALVISTELEPETLILILNAAAILLVVLWQKSQRWTAAAGAGLLLGLSTTARPVAAGFIVLVGAWMLWRSRKAALLLVGMAILPILVVAGINGRLVGNLFIMQPGSQFYDGNNPLSTGCAGVLPRIVADFDSTSREPDYLHVAYRVVAARATGTAIDARRSNRYWSAKAAAFLREYPGRAFSLFMWKGIMSIHNYDIYDLLTTKLKGVELARYPAIPFGAVVMLAILAFVVHERRLELLPVASFAAATLAALLLFNVSARQRTAFLAPLAILAGIGVSALIRLARLRSVQAMILLGVFLVGTAVLGIEGPPSLENDYMWRSRVDAQRLRERAVQARNAGRQHEAVEAAAMASIFNPQWPPLVSLPALRTQAIVLATNTESERWLFDAAVALQKSGAWREADALLQRLEDYRPLRENRAVSSVAYYRARAAVHLHAPAAVVRGFLDRAIAEAPGHPDVLALRAVTGSPHDAALLDAFHDSFTRDFALATAYADVGNMQRADALLARIQAAIPEWQRPAMARRMLRANP